MANTLITCKSCGKEIAASAKTCPHCGAKNKKPIQSTWWVWVLGLIIAIGVIGGGNDSSSGVSAPQQNGEANSATASHKVDSQSKNSKFDGDCGIAATAEMGTDIIGQPTVTVSISNKTDKDISAIQFYAVPFNVYGEEVTGIFAQNKLSTDNTIPAGGTDSLSWQFLENEVKTVRLYVYSVFFSDGTEWGDKDATKSVIMKNALEVEVSGKSE